MRAFLDTHAALIMRLARSLVRERGEAVEPHDVAQEVIVALLQLHKAGSFDPARIENPEAYLRVVVRNAAHRARTRRKLVERVADDGDLTGIAEQAARIDAESVPTPEEITKRAHDARRTIELLKSKLRPRDAVAFALLVEEGLEIDEVAARLGTTANNVYQMRHRILTTAREFLGKEEARQALDSQRGTT
jgi:RNA polymerase sigma factor (sigma-70 family)